MIAGDGVFATFPHPVGAIAAAVEAQRDLAAEPWPDEIEVRVRIGIHTGVVTSTQSGYAGVDLHRAARISSAAWGGQTLVSATTKALAEGDLPQGVTLRDLGEHRLRDVAAPIELYELAAAGLPRDLPPPRTVDAIVPGLPRHNLPSPADVFVGRGDEIATVDALLVDHRLVTFTGVGGVGKTRLAVEIAHNVVDRFPDGTWLVELASLTSPDLVVRTLASALGIREQEGTLLLDTVIDALKERSCLIVLDNCEHLIEASAALASTILTHCPEVRLLATSREALAVPGEAVRTVRSLEVPGDDEGLNTSDLAAHESVRLFLARASQASSSFAPSSEILESIAQICRRLDGIPLAIELAASRLRSLDIAHLAARLDDRFRLLAGGSRTALPRQRTLEATLDWSHDLLDGDEPVLFRRLAVFVSGFTIESCEEVCALDPLKPDDVGDLLEALVDKSLVVVDDPDGNFRYRMLETIRDYARTKLLDAGELEQLRDAHAGWAARLVQSAEPYLRGPDQRSWLDALDREHAEIRAALTWAVDRAMGDLASAIAVGSVWFAAKRGHSTESVDWCSKVLELPPDAISDPLPVKLALGSAATPLPAEELPATYSFDAVVDLARSKGSQRDVGVALTNLAVRAGREEISRGVRLLQEAVATLEELGPSPELGDALFQLAAYVRLSGDADAARHVAMRAYGNAIEIGELWDVAWSLTLIAVVDRDTGETDEAASRLLEASEIFALLGDEFGRSWVDGALGIVELVRGDFDAASGLLLAAWKVTERMGLRAIAAELSASLARVARLTGEHEAAAAWIREGLLVSETRFAVLAMEEAAALRAEDRPLEAARLFAATAAWRERSGHPQQPHWALHLEPLVESLRERLGDEPFAAAWAEGERFDEDGARESSLRLLGGPTD